MLDPASDPTFFLGYLGEQVRREAPGGRGAAAMERAGRPPDGPLAHRRPRPPRRGRLAVLRGAHRRRDRLRRLPHRAVRGRVGARRPPGRGRGRGRGRPRRGARLGRAGRGGAARRRPAAHPELVRELQDHVKRETAPYKYPRIVEFAAELPKTASGKIKRAELRGDRWRSAASGAPRAPPPRRSRPGPRAAARPRRSPPAPGARRRRSGAYTSLTSAKAPRSVM